MSNYEKAINSGLTVGKNTFIKAHIQRGNADKVVIGNNVIMGHESYVVTHCPIRSFTEDNGIIIEDHCWIGSRAMIMPGVTLGRGTFVGAGAVVSKDTEPFSIVVGNPAKKIKMREVNEILRSFVIRHVMKKSLNGKVKPDWDLLKPIHIRNIFDLPRDYLLSGNDPLKELIPWEDKKFTVNYFFEELRRIGK